MLTKKQIKELPKGTYTNEYLMRMFPNQQGRGKSSAPLLDKLGISNFKKRQEL